MANNHAADYGPIGLKDTLAAIRTSPIPVIGIGRDSQAAFAPYRVSLRGTDFAFLAADGSKRESSSSVWAATPATPGVAAAHAGKPPALLAAVRAASRQDDVVVVYLHWGTEGRACPTRRQRSTARALADAGADVIVGSHSHVLLGSGWMGKTYVNYGLGTSSGTTTIIPSRASSSSRRDGEVVGDSWTPARIETYGRPLLSPASNAPPRSPTGDGTAVAPVSLRAQRSEGLAMSRLVVLLALVLIGCATGPNTHQPIPQQGPHSSSLLLTPGRGHGESR
jgi:poly-gamma-glutamate synthesis protein (capsule biosynthesis protein)